MVESTAVPCIIQTSTIILWTELFPKKREREDIQGEILQSSSSTVVFPHAIQQLQDNSTYKNYSVYTYIKCHYKY